jgi:hypothetical protein
MADETPNPEIKVAEPGKLVETPQAPNPLPHYGDSGLGSPEVHIVDGKIVPGPAPEMRVDQHGQWAPLTTALTDEAKAEAKPEEKPAEEHKAE